jgi:steroid delta-isomerase-like uncharacterized protein
MDEELRRRREQLVRRHIEVENAGDADALVATFYRPRYDLVAVGVVREGPQQVRQHVLALQAALPGCVVRIAALHHADDAVIVETRTTGHHAGDWNGIGPNGRAIDIRGIAIFAFEGDRLIEERVYYDRQTLREQITPPPAD